MLTLNSFGMRSQFRRRKGSAVAIALLAAAGLVTSGTGPAAAAAPVAASAQDRSGPVATQLQEALDAVVAAGASGAVVRVDDGRRTYRLASGKARLEPSQRMRPDARFRSGSLTKSFVSTVALQLVGEGRISLDDTIERWQPGLVPGGENITLRQLLNHTSGLFDFTEDQAFLERVFTDPLQPLAPQELIAVANSHPPVFAPGTDWSYSNTNYIVAGLILEKVTHRTLSQLIDRRITRPLELRDTYLPETSPDIKGHHAHGYFPPGLSGDGYLDVTQITASWIGAAGALVSNTDDVRRFYRALLGGKLLRPAQLAQMKTFVPTPDGILYGLGLYRLQTSCGPIWGHDGSLPGYQTIAWNDETGQRGVAINVPTQPDGQIAAAFGRLIEIATCQALGSTPSTAAAPDSTLRTAQADAAWSLRIDPPVRSSAVR
jgi:D-alanyl-D-alanine carboxypeptidase